MFLCKLSLFFAEKHWHACTNRIKYPSFVHSPCNQKKIKIEKLFVTLFWEGMKYRKEKKVSVRQWHLPHSHSGGLSGPWSPKIYLRAQDSQKCTWERAHTHTHRSLRVPGYISTTAGPIVYCQWSQTSLKFNLICCKPKCHALRWQLKAPLSDNWVTLANNSLCVKWAGADIL